MSEPLDVERHLTNAANRRALADEQEVEAVRLAESRDPETVLLAAAHFTVAIGLGQPADPRHVRHLPKLSYGSRHSHSPNARDQSCTHSAGILRVTRELGP